MVQLSKREIYGCLRIYRRIIHVCRPQDISSDAIMGIVNEILNSQKIEELARQYANEDNSNKYRKHVKQQNNFSDLRSPKLAMDGPVVSLQTTSLVFVVQEVRLV